MSEWMSILAHIYLKSFPISFLSVGLIACQPSSLALPFNFLQSMTQTFFSNLIFSNLNPSLIKPNLVLVSPDSFSLKYSSLHFYPSKPCHVRSRPSYPSLLSLYRQLKSLCMKFLIEFSLGRV